MIGTTVFEGKRKYLCDECKIILGQFPSLRAARASGWAISRNRKQCYCPSCATGKRHVGRGGGNKF